MIDLNCNELTQKDLKWADYVYLSAMSIQKKSAIQVIKQYNDAGIKIVAGGPLFTSEYEQFDTIDHFVLNEAEITLVEFLKDFEQGNA